MKRFLSIILALLPFLYTEATEENRLKLTIHEAERYLADHNLRLLAEHYAVDQAEARVIQAKLFDNPVISFEQNVYNRINGRYFDFGKEGESAVELEQLIYIAGQHNKRVKLEKINHEMSAYQYEEVARSLRGELRQKFVELYFTRRSLTVYEDEIQAINDLLAIYKTQQEKGNISLLEKARLEALLLALRQEQGDLINQTTALSGELRLLLGINDQTQVEPVIDESALDRIDLSDISFADLLARLPERPDLKIAQSKRRASEADLKLQRALAFPEVSLKGSYDKAGNFINDYWAIGLSISLPIFNRNQGNIKASGLFGRLNGLSFKALDSGFFCYSKFGQDGNNFSTTKFGGLLNNKISLIFFEGSKQKPHIRRRQRLSRLSFKRDRNIFFAYCLNNGKKFPTFCVEKQQRIADFCFHNMNKIVGGSLIKRHRCLFNQGGGNKQPNFNFLGHVYNTLTLRILENKASVPLIKSKLS